MLKMVAAATRLVAEMDEAQRTGQGDTRSNKVTAQLLALVRQWVSEMPVKLPNGCPIKPCAKCVLLDLCEAGE
jgi:hypothetical protein